MAMPTPASDYRPSDRRGKRRYPLFEDALLSDVGMHGHACKIRECSARGMRLSFKPSAHSGDLAELRIDQVVRVHFIAAMPEGPQLITLRARIVHVFNNALGVQLLGVTKRDIKAMRALVAAAQQRGPHRATHSEADLNIVAPPAAGSRSARSDAPGGDSPLPAPAPMRAPMAAPLLECMDVLYLGAPRLSERVVDAFEEAVQHALQHAREPARQRGLKDVLHELLETRADVNGDLQRQLWAQFAQLFEAHADKGDSHFAPLSLSDASMMQTVFLSAELSVAELIVALESHVSAKVFRFENRFSDLSNRPLHRHNNPVSVEGICRVCHDALLDRFPQPFLKEPLHAALSAALKAGLNDLYDRVIAAMTTPDAPSGIAATASTAARR